MNRLQELFFRWQDGVLTPAESDELARLLESGEAREFLVEEFFTIQTLREGLGNAAAARPRSRRRLWIALSSAAAILAALGAFFFLGTSTVAVARVTEVRGTVVGDDGAAVAAESDVFAGRGFRTVGAASGAVLRFPDGTRVDLGGDTALDSVDELPDGKQISIVRGTASAVVRPQRPDRPMVFSTPHGQAKVLGTTLRLSVDAQGKGGTRLEVKEGKVQLQNLAGKTVLVESGHFAVAAAGLELTARRSAPAKAMELVRRMAPDSWLAVSDSHLRKASPDPSQYPKIQLVSGVKSVISAWSGGVFDPSRDRLVVWGGGASTYAGNEIYAFDLHDLMWVRVTDPTADPALGKQVNNDGTPAGRGTYNGLAYIAHSDRMFAAGGAIAGNAGNVGADITWTFDFEKRRWVDMKPAGSRPQTQAQNSCAYDPVTRKVWWLDGTGLFSYDVDSNSWARHTTEGQFDRTIAVDTKRRRLVMVGQGEVLMVDPAAASPKPVPWKTTGGDAFLRGRVGLDYDPVADRIVGWAGGPVYSLDPDTGAWTAHNAAGAPKATEAGIYGRWRYVPSLNAFVVATDVDENVHFFKLAR
jgi:ferric-dicitrate binding protein FerR (iron transport regulator)